MIGKVPQGHSTSFIVFPTKSYVIEGMFAWGDVLLKKGSNHSKNQKPNVVVHPGGKTRSRQEKTPLAYLGYYTDNGAYYYDRVERTDYYNTLLDLKAEFQRLQLPVAYMQLDSWWYRWGADHGVDQWLPRVDATTFPTGKSKKNAEKKTVFPTLVFFFFPVPPLNMPQGLQMHNRYWSRDTKMASQFTFEKSLPHSKAGGGNAIHPINIFFFFYFLSTNRSWHVVSCQ